MNSQPFKMKPIKRELVHAKIADAMMQYIAENHLTDGDKLPPEREMAAYFDTSRNSVREALRVLESNGIVEIRQGSGIFIRTNGKENSFYEHAWKINYMELLDIKDMLEVGLAKTICGKLDETQLRQLETQIVLMEELAEENAYNPEIDGIFHKMLWGMSSNKTLVDLLNKMFEQLREYWRTLKGEEKMWLLTVPYHRQLFEAIRDDRKSCAEEAINRITQIDKDITVWMQKTTKPFKA